VPRPVQRDHPVAPGEFRNDRVEVAVVPQVRVQEHYRRAAALLGEPDPPEACLRLSHARPLWQLTDRPVGHFYYLIHGRSGARCISRNLPGGAVRRDPNAARIAGADDTVDEFAVAAGQFLEPRPGSDAEDRDLMPRRRERRARRPRASAETPPPAR